MIAGQKDEGIVGDAGFFQRVEDDADLIIDSRDQLVVVGEIAAHFAACRDSRPAVSSWPDRGVPRA